MKKAKIVLIASFCMLFINLVFIDNVLAKTYNNVDGSTVSCGDKLVDSIPIAIPKVVSTVYTVIQIVIPVLLVIFGMLDLVKAITAQKEDEMKKGQQMLVKRLISAAIVFFVFVVVKLLISVIADGTSSKIIDCAECFIENNDKCVKSK